MSSAGSINEKEQAKVDLEGQVSEPKKKYLGIISRLQLEEGEVYHVDAEKNPKWYQKLLDMGVEENGIKPVPVELRTQTQYNNIFTVFFTCLLCLLP
jgi:hypothetical protein